MEENALEHLESITRIAALRGDLVQTLSESAQSHKLNRAEALEGVVEFYEAVCRIWADHDEGVPCCDQG